MFGCSKDAVEPTTLLNSSQANGTSLRLDNRLDNPNDLEDENMNDQLFMLANGLSSFATNNELLGIIYAQLQLRPEDGVTYSKLILLDSRFHVLMNDYLKPNCFPEKPVGHDCYAEIDDAMIYKGVDYYPGIGCPNILTANLNADPIMTMMLFLG